MKSKIKCDLSKKNIKNHIQNLELLKLLYRFKNIKKDYYYESTILVNKYLRQLTDKENRELLRLSHRNYYDKLKNSYEIYYDLYLYDSNK